MDIVFFFFEFGLITSFRFQTNGFVEELYIVVVSKFRISINKGDPISKSKLFSIVMLKSPDLNNSDLNIEKSIFL